METDQEDEEQADFELEEEEEEKEPLTPAKKRARRYTALLAGGFLLLCLAVGIFLGIRRMEQLDALEKAYDEKIEKSETAFFKGKRRKYPAACRRTGSFSEYKASACICPRQIPRSSLRKRITAETAL